MTHEIEGLFPAPGAAMPSAPTDLISDAIAHRDTRPNVAGLVAPTPADAPTSAESALDSRSPAEGRRALSRLADGLLPALIARFSSGELGELEVRESGWRVRLRRDLQVERSGGAAAPEARPASTAERASARGPSPTAPADSPARRLAASPAVGYYAPRDGMVVGRAVRAGDLLGSVEVLGVRQAVVAPVDGVIGKVYATAGEAVEYGQRLVRVDTGDRTGVPSADREPLSAGRGAAPAGSPADAGLAGSQAGPGAGARAATASGPTAPGRTSPAAPGPEPAIPGAVAPVGSDPAGGPAAPIATVPGASVPAAVESAR